MSTNAGEVSRVFNALTTRARVPKAMTRTSLGSVSYVSFQMAIVNSLLFLLQYLTVTTAMHVQIVV